jgi:hypothetical protein
MSKHIGHHTTINEEVFVDSNFINALRNIDVALSHLGWGDWKCDVNGVDVQFRRRDGSMETPAGFVGRPHCIYSASNDIIQTILSRMITTNSTEEV